MASFNGPEGVALFRLIAMRSAVALEAKGLRLHRGRKWTPQAKREFGLKRNATTEEVIRAIDDAIAVAKTVADMTPSLRSTQVRSTGAK